MDQGKLNHWLEQRDKKKKAEFALKKTNKKVLNTLTEGQIIQATDKKIPPILSNFRRIYPF